jgi:hypothetical protein
VYTSKLAQLVDFKRELKYNVYFSSFQTSYRKRKNLYRESRGISDCTVHFSWMVRPIGYARMGPGVLGRGWGIGLWGGTEGDGWNASRWSAKGSNFDGTTEPGPGIARSQKEALMLRIGQLDHAWLRFTFPTSLLGNRKYEIFKKYPGVRYAPEVAKGVWVAPMEAFDWLIVVGESIGLQFKLDGKLEDFLNSPPGPPPKVNPKAHPYQQDGVEYILEDKAFFLAYEMGVGKTLSCIEAIRLSGAQRILVVCPAIARDSTWPDEIKKWWPECPLEVSPLQGRKTIPLSKGISVVSYGCLDKTITFTKYDMVILDESHYCCNSGTARTNHVKILRKHNPQSYWVQLTGTPIGNKPADLWQQLDLLYPRRYGTRTVYV